ncbi:hypothetical protein TrLO_g5034 [Triparma laevis f. longispina]|uniref:Uncharacterized protein n=1 Tax=Triparma laevis f. longispina TaxID=1714387 RepID=A0A9W6ZCT3_9STRA|nr:hypothetical protein TrLO_g5034 [Triparma laevis f. longispina]
MSSFTSPPLYTYSGYVQDILQMEFYQAEPPSIPALCGGSTGIEIRERWCYVLRREGSEFNVVSDSDDSMEVDIAPTLAPSPKQRSRKTSDFNAPSLQIVVYSDLNLKLHTYVSVSGYVERSSSDDDDENFEMLHCKTIELGRSIPTTPRSDITELSVLKSLELKLGSEPLSSLLLLWLLSGKEKSDSTIGQLNLTFEGGDANLVSNLTDFVSAITDDSTTITSEDLNSDGLELRKIGEDRIKFSKLQGASGKAIILDYTSSLTTNEANKSKNMKYIDECVKDGAVKCHFGFFDGKMDGDYRYITVEPKKTVSFAGGEDQQAQNIVMGRANVAVKLKDGTNIKGESRIGENEDIKDFVNYKRSLFSSNLVILPAPVCTAAESLFVSKRRSTETNEKISEKDLERWLTFTRLYARLRGEGTENGIEASVADFQSAVDLDNRLKEQGYIRA